MAEFAFSQPPLLDPPVAAAPAAAAAPAGAPAAASVQPGARKRRQSTPRRETPLPPLRTVGQAVDRMREQLDERVQAGIDEHAAPNVALPGDAPVRAAFYTLLPAVQQRLLFLEYASQPRAWPRIRGLFGAPPYGFLQPGDAATLSASGFARGRVNMTFDALRTVSAYAHFGAGQLQDELEREYNVVIRGKTPPEDEDPLLFDLQETSTGTQLVLQVRVKRRSRDQRVAIMKEGAQRAQLEFPRPGHQVTLAPKQAIQRLLGAQGPPPERTVRVNRVAPRSANCSTAAMLVEVV